MKRKFIICLAAILLMLLTMLPGCVQKSVDVSRNADENKFVLKFQILNTSEYHTFELAAGDELEAEIIRETGDICLTVQKGKDTPVYEGAKPLSGKFRIRITESGAYRVTVFGKGAKGSADFRVIRSDSKEGKE